MVSGINSVGRGVVPFTPPGAGIQASLGNAASRLNEFPPVDFGSYKATKASATPTASPTSNPMGGQSNWLGGIVEMLTTMAKSAVQPVSATSPSAPRFSGDGDVSATDTQAPTEKPTGESKSSSDGKAGFGSNPNDDTTEQSREDNCGPTAVARATGKDAEQVTAESENDGSYQPGGGSTVEGVQQQLSKASGKDAKVDGDTSQENIAAKAQNGPTVITCFTPEGGGHVITANKDGTFSDNGRTLTREQLDSEGYQLDNVVSAA